MHTAICLFDKLFRDEVVLITWKVIIQRHMYTLKHLTLKTSQDNGHWAILSHGYPRNILHTSSNHLKDQPASNIISDELINSNLIKEYALEEKFTNYREYLFQF
jgi:hypothetical protein